MEDYSKMEDTIESMRVSIDLMKNRMLNLEQENERLKDENYKDEELQDMKQKISQLREDAQRGFQITEFEKELIETWKKLHASCPASKGCAGSKFTYEFIPTPLGTIGKIKCSCGEEYCFRDLE